MGLVDAYQISVLYHPEARCANVTYDYSEDQITVDWVLGLSAATTCSHHGSDGHNLETIVRDLMGG